MSGQPRLIVIAQRREFDEEKWKQLLMTLAYFLHEQRKVQAAAQSDNRAATQTAP